MANPLSYDSFNDPHLQNYFGNKNVRKHLRKIGLLNRYGEIIPYKEYEATLIERRRQEHVKALLSHGVVQRVIELEKSRQANIRNQFEFAAKRMIVENVKESRQQTKQIRSKDFILLNRPKTSEINSNYIHQQQKRILDENKETPSRLSSIYPLRSSTKTNISTRHKSPRTIKSSNVNVKNSCEITMSFLGPQTSIDAFKSNSYEIIVMQQHCGGENLIIFKNTLQSNEEFTFESRRHSNYPFALTLYVNGLIDSRISVCCEYKHKQRVPLGGKRGSFAILNVQGGQPCQTCRFNDYMANHTFNQQKSTDQSSIDTDTSKYETNTHRLLRTPTPEDEQQNDQINSNQNDEDEQAEEMYEKLLKKLKDADNWEENVALQLQLGNLCKEGLIDYNKALDHYLICLEIWCQHISPYDIRLRNLYLSIGHLLLLIGKNESNLSVEYFQRVLDIDKLNSNKNENNLINDYNYLGLLYLNQKNYSQALFHFEKSLQYFLLINSNTHFYQNNSKINLNIYDRKALESLSINKLPSLSEIHFNLATTYQNLGQMQNALIHAQKALQLSTFDQNKFQFYQDYLKKLQQI